MEELFSEFNEFKESDKSVKHELESIIRSSLLPVSDWHFGSILATNTQGCWFE